MCFFFGLCFFAGLQAQEAVATENSGDKNMVQRSSLTVDDIASEYAHFPKPVILEGEDAKTASARHRKALMEWKQKYPKEYSDFEKKMRENVKLTDQGKKSAAKNKAAAESSLEEESAK